MKVNPVEIMIAAKEFQKSAEDANQITDHLSEVMKRLNTQWSEASQQRFYVFFEEWHGQMDGFTQMLEAIGQELEAIAHRYSEADDISI